MRDWRSYDAIADAYDRVWSPRFATVARHVWTLLAVTPEDRVLDVGTGTGIVLSVLADACAAALAVGCDRSAGMLQRARDQVRAARVVTADAGALPFRSGSFSVATASFVLSHLPDYGLALAEIARVLGRGGRIAVSNWTPPSDPYGAAWSECLAGVLSRADTQQATAEVIPWEEHFSRPGSLEAALSRAGFSDVTTDVVAVASEMTVEQFLQDRELSSTGRYGRHVLGPGGWARFREAASDMFHTRFGRSFRYDREAVIARGVKP